MVRRYEKITITITITITFLPSYFVNGVANDFVEEDLPITHDVEGGEPAAFLSFHLDDAIGDVRIGSDAFLFESHQGTAHVGGGGDE